MTRTATSGRRWLTTGQVAELLGVSPATVAKLCNTRALKSWRLPSGHRRIERSEVERFVAENGLPPLESGTC